MKATGIVRRIDDLGRVVIPKEIRRTLRIKDGDAFEIYIEDGAVIYKKYYPMDNLASLAAQYAEVLYNMSAHAVLITDRDHIVTACGVSKLNYLERRITYGLEYVLECRKTYQYQEDNLLHPVEGVPTVASYVQPIISRGELYGSVVLLADDKNRVPSDVDMKLAQQVAALLGKQLEE